MPGDCSGKKAVVLIWCWHAACFFFPKEPVAIGRDDSVSDITNRFGHNPQQSPQNSPNVAHVPEQSDNCGGIPVRQFAGLQNDRVHVLPVGNFESFLRRFSLQRCEFDVPATVMSQNKIDKPIAKSTHAIEVKNRNRCIGNRNAIFWRGMSFRVGMFTVVSHDV